jgi:hypothetical protein
MSFESTGSIQQPSAQISLGALRRFFAVIIPANLIWEFAHMPLYTIWNEGSWSEIIFAAIHCTGGDILIAMSALMLALILAGRGWPFVQQARQQVNILAVVFGHG